MVFLLIIAAGVSAVLFAVGAALALFAVGVFAALTGLGMVSSSVLYGLFRKRLTAGIQAIVVQAGVVIGALTGVGTLFLAKALIALDIAPTGAVITGALAGAFSGVILAFVILWAWKWATVVFVEKLEAAVPSLPRRPGSQAA